MILSIKTDNPVAEIGLFNPKGGELSYYKWPADRQLAKDLLKVVHGQLQKQSANWPDVTGVIAFKGPGSFTGLRIGSTVANTIAYAQTIPIVAEMGDKWLERGIERLESGQNDKLALPHYGAEANITIAKK